MKHTKCSFKLCVAMLFLILSFTAKLPGVNAQNNPNTITFDNQSGQHAIVKLIGPTKQTVEVPSGLSRRVNTAAGEYYILTRYGSKPKAYKYAKGDPFTVTQTATQYSTITITLHKVIGGSYPTHPISGEEFEKTFVTQQKATGTQQAAKDITEGRDIVDLLKEKKKEATKSKLFIETDPPSARVRILNIKPKFYQGIEVKPGKYHIEVSAKGYELEKKWVTLDAGDNRRLSIDLQKSDPTKARANLPIIRDKTEASQEKQKLPPRESLIQGNIQARYRKNGIPNRTRRIVVKDLAGGRFSISTLPGGQVHVVGGRDIFEGPGTQEVHIELEPGIMATTYYDLTFTTPCVVSILKDGTLVTNKEGIVAKNKQGISWKSHKVFLNNEHVIAFFPTNNRKKSQLPSSQPSSSTSNVIKRAGIYVAYANGIVKDTKTGLEWVTGPDKDTTWDEARSWVKSLNLDGGGWRMPTMDELEALYKKCENMRNMTLLLKTTGWEVWSNKIQGSSDAKCFNFYYGKKESHLCTANYFRRAFAVRSRDLEQLSAQLETKQRDSQSHRVEVGGVPLKPSYGIVRDTKTGLEWVAGPDRNTTWNEARSWVQSLNLDGGGWRMPTMDELEGIFKRGAGEHNMTLPLKTTGWWVWSGETKGSSDAKNFGFAGCLATDNRELCSDRRAFAVRSQRGSETKSVDLATGADGSSKKTVKVSQAGPELESLLPRFQTALKGRNEVCVKNSNDFSVVAGVRKGKSGVNLTVPENGTASVFVPDGKYDIFFVYSNKPDALFQGDSFTLNHNGVEIQIIKVVGGNYGIRQVK